MIKHCTAVTTNTADWTQNNSTVLLSNVLKISTQWKKGQQLSFPDQY